MKQHQINRQHRHIYLNKARDLTKKLAVLHIRDQLKQMESMNRENLEELCNELEREVGEIEYSIKEEEEKNKPKTIAGL